MKKLFLTIFFAAYYIFIPFILINCSSAGDLDYLSEPTLSTETGDEMALEYCLSQEFLTEECVEFVQAQEETARTQVEAIRAAYAQIPDFLDCQLIETATVTDETPTAEATDETTATEDEDATETADASESTTDTTDTETTANVTVDADAAAELALCEQTIETMSDGYAACETFTESGWTYSCEEILSTLNSAFEKCDASDTSVTIDFCNLIG